MRFSIPGFFLLTSTLLAGGAQASSFIAIGEPAPQPSSPTTSSSIIMISPVAEASPSIVVLAPLTPDPVVAEPVVAETSEPAKAPMFARPMPTVIRAGIEGEAFTRAISPEPIAPRVDARPEPTLSGDSGRSGSGDQPTGGQAPVARHGESSGNVEIRTVQ